MCGCSTIQRGSMRSRRFGACIYLTFQDLCTRKTPYRFARRNKHRAPPCSSAEVAAKSGEEKA